MPASTRRIGSGRPSRLAAAATAAVMTRRPAAMCKVAVIRHPPDGCCSFPKPFFENAVPRRETAILIRARALASTLVAGLELEREGAAALAQDKAFGPVRTAPS